VIGPWLLLIIYDCALYIFRAATYNIPYVGGRARNRPRPRAPSLGSGRARAFSLPVPGVPTAIEVVEDTVDELKKRLNRPGYGGNGSNILVD